MSFIIQAPYPLMQSTLLMSSPRVGNQKNLASSVQSMRSMSGKLYTYVKGKRGRKVFQWDFVGSKDKAREAIQFVKEYSGGLVRVTDQNSNTHIGWVTVNPLEIEGQGGQPNMYRWTISIEEKVL